MTDREQVESYRSMVKFIAAVCGPRCEVVLHYLEDDIEHSIIAIENGHISGRRVGDGFMDFAAEQFFTESEQDFVVNLSGKSTKDGKTLRFSGYAIRRDGDREIIGFLCVTEDLTNLINAREIIDSELFLDGGTYSEKEAEGIGASALSLVDTLESLFRHALEESGSEDPHNLTREEKLKIIAILKDNNLFAIKGAVNFIARKISLSEASVYRYLKEVRGSDGYGF